ncbi:MAG: methyltransferase domain-containing protein [bacterium]|nr:methyltransferase domain-containing protein [bacterium]
MALTGGTELLNANTLLERVGLRAGMHVADLGCGVTGHYIVPAARIVGGDGKAYAVDIQKSALAATESRAKIDGITNLTSVWSNIERLGATRIPPVSLDVTMIVNTLHLTTDRNQAIAEAARLTKSGGTVAIVEWKTDATAIGPPAAKRIGKEVVRAAAKAAGLVEHEEFEAGAYHYGLTFTKP